MRKPYQTESPTGWQWIAALSIGAILGLAMMMCAPRRARAQELGELPVPIAVHRNVLAKLEAGYSPKMEAGYCLEVKLRGGVWYIESATRPVPAAASRDSVVFGCRRGAARLHTHGGDSSTVDLRHPGLSDLRALRASGALFDVIQYGPRALYAYAAPPLPTAPLLKAAARDSNAIASTDDVVALQGRRDRLTSLLDALAAGQARLDTLVLGLGFAGREVTILPPDSAGRGGSSWTGVASVVISGGAGYLGGRRDRDAGGYADSWRPGVDKLAHGFGSVIACRALSDRFGPVWGSLAGVALGLGIELGQGRDGGRSSRQDLGYDVGGCAIGTAWSASARRRR